MSVSVAAMAPPTRPEATAPDVLPGKRKRSADQESDNHPRAKDEDSPRPMPKPQGLDDFLRDLLEILQPHDTTPSILKHPLSYASETIPSAKRAKTAKTTRTPRSIRTKITSSAYQSVEELSQDLATAISTLTASQDQPLSDTCTQFRSQYEEILERQRTQDRSSVFQEPSSPAICAPQTVVAIMAESGEQTLEPSGTALSFAGPGGRPYFSSLLKRDSVQTKGSATEGESTVLENVLPKGIWTSTMIPVRGRDSRSKATHVPTLGEICPKPAHLVVLEPPRESPLASTRGSTVGWYKPGRIPTARARIAGRESYNNQKLSMGTWLAGTNSASLAVPNFEERKRQKERALGSGELQVEKSREERDKERREKQRAQRDRAAATFRSIYSTFAPSFDNTNAIVPQEQRRQLWWSHKVATRKRRASTEIPEGSAVEVGEVTLDSDLRTPLDPALLEEAIDDFKEESTDSWDVHTSVTSSTSAPKSAKDTDEILAQLSEMLETLGSYQRNRHVELRTKHSSADENGTPSRPSSAEFDLHKALRDQLAALVSSLPPYAVARLDGDRFKALNISSVLELEDEIHRGLLEDDAKPNQQQINAARAAPLRHPSISSARPGPYGTPTASPAARNSFSTARPPTSYLPARIPSRSSGSYTTYQHQQSQATPRPSHQPQADGNRPSNLPNGYLPNANSGVPMTPRAPQYQASAQVYQPRPIQSNAIPGSYGVESPLGAAHQQLHATPTNQQGRSHHPASATTSQLSNSGLPQSSTGSPYRGALANGVGTVGAQMQMNVEERMQLQSRQKQAEQTTAQMRPPSGHDVMRLSASPLKVQGASPQQASDIP